MVDHHPQPGAFWLELGELLEGGFTGQVVLHCNRGEVVKYEQNEVRRPGQPRPGAGRPLDPDPSG